MADQRKRVIVDGVEFASIFWFPRVLWACLAAVRPGALILGLGMVAAMFTFGRAWDSWNPRQIVPDGPPLADMTGIERERVRREIATAFSVADLDQAIVPGLRTTAVPDLGAIQQAVERWYASDGQEAQRDSVERLLDRLGQLQRIQPQGIFEASVGLVCEQFNYLIAATLRLDWPAMIDSGHELGQLPVTLWRDHRGFAMVYGLFLLVLLPIGGGALSRMAACQWSGGGHISMGDAADFALSSWWRLLSAVLLPLLFLGLAVLPILIAGWLSRLPWIFDVLGSAAYGLALLFGLLVGFLLIGVIAGSPLLMPAVACENCDGADAQQRAIAYVMNRPLHWAGYLLVGLVGLVVGYLFVSVFAMLIINITTTVFAAAAGAHPALEGLPQARFLKLAPMADPPGPGGERVRVVIDFWQTLIRCLVGSYVLAYVFHASTMMYLLLRQACDGQSMDEIWRDGMMPGGFVPAPEEE